MAMIPVLVSPKIPFVEWNKQNARILRIFRYFEKPENGIKVNSPGNYLSSTRNEFGAWREYIGRIFPELSRENHKKLVRLKLFGELERIQELYRELEELRPYFSSRKVNGENYSLCFNVGAYLHNKGKARDIDGYNLSLIDAAAVERGGHCGALDLTGLSCVGAQVKIGNPNTKSVIMLPAQLPLIVAGPVPPPAPRRLEKIDKNLWRQVNGIVNGIISHLNGGKHYRTKVLIHSPVNYLCANWDGIMNSIRPMGFDSSHEMIKRMKPFKVSGFFGEEWKSYFTETKQENGSSATYTMAFKVADFLESKLHPTLDKFLLDVVGCDISLPATFVSYVVEREKKRVDTGVFDFRRVKHDTRIILGNSNAVILDYHKPALIVGGPRQAMLPFASAPVPMDLGSSSEGGGRRSVSSGFSSPDTSALEPPRDRSPIGGFSDQDEEKEEFVKAGKRNRSNASLFSFGFDFQPQPEKEMPAGDGLLTVPRKKKKRRLGPLPLPSLSFLSDDYDMMPGTPPSSKGFQGPRVPLSPVRPNQLPQEPHSPVKKIPGDGLDANENVRAIYTTTGKGKNPKAPDITSARDHWGGPAPR